MNKATGAACNEKAHVTAFEGELTASDFIDAAQHNWSLCEAKQLHLLWDLRNASFDLDVAALHLLAEYAREHGPRNNRRMAFVVSTKLQHGIVRMFLSFFDRSREQMGLFRCKQRALDWLSQKSRGSSSSDGGGG